MNCEKGKKITRNWCQKALNDSNEENQTSSLRSRFARVVLARRTDKNMWRTFADNRRTTLKKTDSYIRGNTVLQHESVTNSFTIIWYDLSKPLKRKFDAQDCHRCLTQMSPARGDIYTRREYSNEWPNSSTSTRIQRHCQVLSWTGPPIGSIISPTLRKLIWVVHTTAFYSGWEGLKGKQVLLYPIRGNDLKRFSKVESINQHLLQITSCFRHVNSDILW